MRKMICLLAVCLLMTATVVSVWADTSLQSMIYGLPAVEAFQAMDSEAQLDAYNKTQAAYDAYMALSEENRAEISGAEETFEALFTYFNTMVMPVEQEAPAEPAGNTPGQERQVIIVTMVTLVVGYAILMKRKR